MNAKKLVSALAAAAMALTGMAFGAAGAYAEESNGTITIHNAEEGHTYTAYRFATLTSVQEGKALEVATLSNWVDKVKTAADAADDTELANNSVPVEYQTNPAAYAATFKSEQIRLFATKLQIPDGEAGTSVKTSTEGDTMLTVPEGWYLIVDADKDGNTSGVRGIVATTIAGAVTGSGGITIVGDGGTGQGTITTLGEINAKNQDEPDKPFKEVVSGDADKTVKVGDVVTYSVTGKVPAAAAGYDKYTYIIRDSASKGLTIDTTLGSYSVVVKNIDGEGTNKTLTAGKDYVFASAEDTNESSDDYGRTITTITIGDATAYAKKDVVFTYKATVNADALNNSNKVDNKAAVNHNGKDSGYGTTIELHTYDITFKKVGVDGDSEKLAGATFAIKVKDGNYLKYENGAWSEDTADNAPTYTVTSGADGMVSFKGLSAGEYTIVETEAPAGYASNFKAAFDVTINKSGGTISRGSITFGTSKWGLVTSLNNGQVGATATVKNVKTVTQLPLTGAAGTALFSAVAALLAVVAGVVTVKLRSTKRELDA